MTTAQMNRSISPEIMPELEVATRHALSGIRDPEAMRRACERMDRMRKKVRKTRGLFDIGVAAIRKLRDHA